ncbi:hypothetical protein J6590_102979 [Homalodisca vitripennis]|nr:hypothetical protein J6590_102979 [Homalodisca vitripennis]
MSKNIAKSNGNPCGVCGKNSKFGSIFCNGPCRQWNHLKCVNLSYKEVKNLPLAEQNVWQCPSCSEKRNKLEECKDLSHDTKEDPNEVEFEDSLSLATELGNAILRENEELKQALHESRNSKSCYDLELEDKLIEKEELIRNMTVGQNKKEDELNAIIKSLENKLIREKKLNVELATEEKREDVSSLKKISNVMCNKCEVYKQETKNMIDSIRSLEAVICDLQNENDALLKENQSNTSKQYDLKCSVFLL